MSKTSKIITAANVITVSRILCTIGFIICMLNQKIIAGFMFFLLAGISDFFDGYIARLTGEESLLGAMLDPIADKFLLLAALLILFFQQIACIIPFWFLLLVATKEGIQIIGGTILCYFSGMNSLLPPTTISKYTTVLLLIFIAFALISLHFVQLSPMFLSGLLYLNTALVLSSFSQYIALFLKKFKN